MFFLPVYVITTNFAASTKNEMVKINETSFELIAMTLPPSGASPPKNVKIANINLVKPQLIRSNSNPTPKKIIRSTSNPVPSTAKNEFPNKPSLRRLQSNMVIQNHNKPLLRKLSSANISQMNDNNSQIPTVRLSIPTSNRLPHNPSSSRMSNQKKRQEKKINMMNLVRPFNLIVFFVCTILYSTYILHRALIGTHEYIEHDDLNELDNSVLYFDEAVMFNVKATLQSAYSFFEWGPSSSKIEVKKLPQFQVEPLMATIDRRPLIARKQIIRDKGALHSNGTLLGCAFSSSTFVSHLSEIVIKEKDGKKTQKATCAVCFQFSNVQDMESFLPDVGYQPIGQTATKCVGARAYLKGRFAKWQKSDERFEGFGYPWNVDCHLRNGIKELACQEISIIATSDSIQKIYFQTKFDLKTTIKDGPTGIRVISRWPWDAVRSHDDDRRKIATNIPINWNDTASMYIPSRHQDLKLVHIEGPGYSKFETEESGLDHGGVPALASMLQNPNSNGGVHFRLVSNLVHLIRNAPKSTHMIAVVDGQAIHTLKVLRKLLHSKISDLYPAHAQSIYQNYDLLKKKEYISITQIKKMKLPKVNKRHLSELTLHDVLRLREIKIHLVPITTPLIAFEKSVCGIQYAVTSYLAARFAADYQVMMYIDGDTAMIEHSSQTLQEILYKRFYSQHSYQCVGHRFRLIEQFVRPEDESPDRVLECARQLSTNMTKWDYVNKNCNLKEGHIAARTDSIYELNVHHPDTLPHYLPPGLKDCISKGNKETQEYFFGQDEIVQIHLRNRQRDASCTCFKDIPIEDTNIEKVGD